MRIIITICRRDKAKDDYKSVVPLAQTTQKIATERNSSLTSTALDLIRTKLSLKAEVVATAVATAAV